MNCGVVTPIPKHASTLKTEVPEASDWNIDDVVEYFLNVGFTEQAEVFREQVRLLGCLICSDIRLIIVNAQIHCGDCTGI
jgi:hypothetical protein